MNINVKKIIVTIPNSKILKRVNSTPALRNVLRSSLKVGDNIESVNHTQYSKAMMLLPLAGCEVKEAKL